MAQNLNNKLVVIDGVEYRLVAVEDKRDKVIVSMITPFGAIQSVHPRYDEDGDAFPLAEGKYEQDGHVFVVEYVAADEVSEHVGKPMEEMTPDDALLMAISLAMSETEDEE
jgi:hypothetical protein